MQKSPSAMPCVCMASARILCSMLAIPFQQRYEPGGKSPEEKSENDHRLETLMAYKERLKEVGLFAL